ncbi:hypothetical protein AOLI_G00117090 [Acnodon oligacanthus]
MLKNLLSIIPSPAYLVTGTVPDPDFRLPQREYSTSRDLQRSRKPKEVREKMKEVREPLKLRVTEGDQIGYKDMSTYFWQTEIMKAGIKTACERHQKSPTTSERGM